MHSVEQVTVDKNCLVVGERSGCPPDAVLRVEFGGQSPPGKSVVESLLGQPGREFPVPIEAETRAHVSHHVMDGPKSVVRCRRGRS